MLLLRLVLGGWEIDVDILAWFVFNVFDVFLLIVPRDTKVVFIFLFSNRG